MLLLLVTFPRQSKQPSRELSVCYITPYLANMFPSLGFTLLHIRQCFFSPIFWRFHHHFPTPYSKICAETGRCCRWGVRCLHMCLKQGRYHSCASLGHFWAFLRASVGHTSFLNPSQHFAQMSALKIKHKRQFGPHFETHAGGKRKRKKKKKKTTEGFFCLSPSEVTHTAAEKLLHDCV